MPSVLTLWNTMSRLPQGSRLFSVAFARKAPYFATIHPRFTEIRPHRAELVIPKRRSVHNHLGTVHAIALCNGLEAAMGALAESTIPRDRRWIPKGMEVAYTAKATTDITWPKGMASNSANKAVARSALTASASGTCCQISR